MRDEKKQIDSLLSFDFSHFVFCVKKDDILLQQVVRIKIQKSICNTIILLRWELSKGRSHFLHLV